MRFLQEKLGYDENAVQYNTLFFNINQSARKDISEFELTKDTNYFTQWIT